jgi:hypothetical protein
VGVLCPLRLYADDVTNFFHTQSNEYLTNHHMLDVKTLHGKSALHDARLGKIADSDAAALRNNMSLPRLAQLRVARFLKKMRPFSECEDPTFRKQATCEWEACGRDTMRPTIGECFLVAPE